MFQSKSEWSLQMDQIPANPKGDICKGPKPKVNGSRRILRELPMLPPPLGDVIALVAGSLRASRFQSGGCHFLSFSVSEAVSTESSVRLSAEDDDSSESSSAGWGSTGQSVGKPKIRKHLAHS